MIARLRSLFAPRPRVPAWSDCIADLTKAEREAVARRDMKAVGKANAEKTERLHKALAGAVRS